MKRFFFLTGVFGVVLSLLAGCKEKPAAQASSGAENQKANGVQASASKAKPVPVQKEAAPGTIGYLDLQNGFRDVTFGQTKTNIANLVLKDRDEARKLETYTRPGDILSLDDVPLESIEYSFLNDQLYEIQLKWKLEYTNSPVKLPRSSALAAHCAALYGSPVRSGATREGIKSLWRGKKIQLIVAETLLPGVADRVNGGWAIPPTAGGRMVIRNVALKRAAEATSFSKTMEKQDEL